MTAKTTNPQNSTCPMLGSGLRVVPGYFDRPAQEKLLAALREVLGPRRSTRLGCRKAAARSRCA
jgi:hypothetical protein